MKPITAGRMRKLAPLLLLCSVLFLLSASSASAWFPGNAYLVVRNSNCLGGGKVVYVGGAVDQTWTGGDWGDNIIYPRVRVGLTNTFNGRGFCDRPWYDPRGDYWINIVWWQFKPTTNRQTFWYPW